MKKQFILNQQGKFELMEWDFNPDKNQKAKEKAENSLKAKNIIGKIYEVAPLCFWYSTKEKEINCGLYN
jgi:hypothetical protein